MGRIETKAGRAAGVHGFREGRWRFPRAKNVVVAGYAIETPRLLLNSASRESPDGLANSSGLVGMPQERNRVTLSEVKDRHGLPVARITYSWCDSDKALNRHALAFTREALAAAGGREVWDRGDDTCHLNGTARMGADRLASVVDADRRSWDIPNLSICDGSVLPTVGEANPPLTIQAIALRTADRILGRRR